MHYNPLSALVRRIGLHGGFVNSHAHFDRAYTIKRKMMNRTNDHLFEKWEYVDNFKRHAKVGDYFENIKIEANKNPNRKPPVGPNKYNNPPP